MEIYKEKRELIYTPEQMFDLVADVESYADFLPGWIDARILEREKEVVFVDQEIGFGILHANFVTQAVFTKPDYIEITSTDGPFLYLAIRWNFQPAERVGCVVHFYAGFELRSRFLEKVAGPLFSDMMRRCVQAFIQRAELIYGSAPENSS